MPLGEIVHEYPMLIPIVGRFGIRLGVGEKSIGEVADQYGVDADFLVMVLNTYLNESYFPEQKLRSFHVSQIVDYLTKTNAYYLRFQLPNIEKHLNAFVATSSPSSRSSLDMLNGLFQAFKRELTGSIARDTEVDFPAFLALSQSCADGGCEEPQCVSSVPESEEQTELLLADMQNILIRFLSGEYNENLCYAVIFALNSMERDIRQHNRIRRRILYPIVGAMRQNAER